MLRKDGIMTLDFSSRSFKVFYWFLFCIYLVLLAKFILFKYGYVHIGELVNTDLEAFKFRISHINYVPFKTISLYLSGKVNAKVSWINLVGNVVGFMPLGFMIPSLVKKLNKFRYILGIGFLFSLGFEIIQLVTGLGEFDVDDLILNTLGALLGYICFYLMGCFYQRINRKK